MYLANFWLYWLLQSGTSPQKTFFEKFYPILITIILILGIILGLLMLGVAIWGYFKRNNYGFGKFTFTVFDTILFLVALLSQANIETPLGKLQIQMNDVIKNQGIIKQEQANLNYLQLQFSETQNKIDNAQKGNLSQLNSVSNNIQVRLTNIQDSLYLIAQKSGNIDKEKLKNWNKTLTNFKDNYRYQVLVFYDDRVNKKSQEIARIIQEKLLKQGFSSSFTATDFSELNNKGMPGTIKFVYLSSICTDNKPPVYETVNNVINTIEEIRKNNAPNSKFDWQSVSTLINGSMQIYLF